MSTSRLTSRARTTVPQAVRRALNLSDGDQIAYRIEDGGVVLTKVVAVAGDPFATFVEWNSEADRLGYKDLESRTRR